MLGGVQLATSDGNDAIASGRTEIPPMEMRKQVEEINPSQGRKIQPRDFRQC